MNIDVTPRAQRRTDRTGSHGSPSPMTALVATDLVGGVWAATSGVNTWAEAWGGRGPAGRADCR